ncbi:MAG: ATP-dependent DNA ligase [Acidisphaera sp.]|nr:ATP-dependent DNA ligase [Acidisphaera sp.]
MALPLDTAYPPMEAESVPSLPDGPEWQYEPKWDGFRCLAFRDASSVDLRSKSGQPLGRYFPELLAALSELAVPRCVLDGEIVVPVDGVPDFEELQMRLHPAASRVRKLAAAHPARYMLFDLLVDDTGRDLTALPLQRRRAALESLMAPHVNERLALSPVSRDAAEARQWMQTLGTGRDGVVAKRLDKPYRSGHRDAVVKVKLIRSADCVVGGFRYLQRERQVGSLLLGLYDGAGLLNHVGFTATIRREDRPALTDRLEKLVEPPGFTGKAPGGPSRWSSGKTHDWQPLRPVLVVEVQYDHVSGERFRHGTTLLRFRPDKAPRQCTMQQIERSGAPSLR